MCHHTAGDLIAKITVVMCIWGQKKWRDKGTVDLVAAVCTKAQSVYFNEF